MRGERELAEAERHGHGVRILANTSSVALLAAVRSAFLGGLFVWKIEGSCLEIEFPFSRRQLCVYLADSALPVEIFLGALCRQGYRYQPRRTPHPVRWKPRSLQSRADFGLDHDCQKYPASSSASAPYRIGPIRRPSQWDRGCRLSAAMAKPYPDGSWTGRGLDSSCSSPWFRDQPSLEFFSRSLCSYSALYRPTNNIHKALEDTNIRKGRYIAVSILPCFQFSKPLAKRTFFLPPTSLIPNDRCYDPGLRIWGVQ